MQGAVFAKLYHGLIATMNKKFWDISTRSNFFYQLCLFSTVLIQHPHPTENQLFLRNNDDIHPIRRGPEYMGECYIRFIFVWL